ncbi:MAG: energy transducer TonB, partial [Gammaproteobacteria bacterium]
PAHAAQFAGIEQRHNTQLNRYGDGERALKRAVLIYQKAEGVEPASLVKSILDLADWYLLFEKWGRAFETYAIAREVALASPTTAARMDEYFGDPRPLYFPLPQPGMAPYSEKKSGHIDVEYDVSDRGEVTDVRVTDAQPPGILDYRMRRYVRMARFRPRFEEGTPVPATALAYRHRFVYTEREEP